MAVKVKGYDSLIARLSLQVSALAPESPQLKEALTRIGSYVAALAKVEARRQGIIDSGRLINSIRYEFFKSGTRTGILVGSFNVKYAALHEFGGVFTDQMRKAMFAAMRRSGRARPGVTKNVIKGGHFRARPYLRPAILKSNAFTLDTLRAALSYANGGK